MTQTISHSTEGATFWQVHVTQFQSAGKNKTQYCKQHNLNYHRFLYWYSKLIRIESDRNETVNLLPVRISTSETKSHQGAVALFKLIKSLG